MQAQCFSKLLPSLNWAPLCSMAAPFTSLRSSRARIASSRRFQASLTLLLQWRLLGRSSCRTAHARRLYSRVDAGSVCQCCGAVLRNAETCCAGLYVSMLFQAVRNCRNLACFPLLYLISDEAEPPCSKMRRHEHLVVSIL